MVVRPKIMFLNICKFHLQFWQMCKLFANKLFSLNIYSYSSVWIIMVHSNFDAKNLHFICLRISPQIFAIVQKFALDNFRDQQFRNLLCEWEWVVMVVFTGNAVHVEVPPGMVWLSILVREEFGGSELHQSPSSGLPVQIPPCLHSTRETSICRHRS